MTWTPAERWLIDAQELIKKMGRMNPRYPAALAEWRRRLKDYEQRQWEAERAAA